MAGITLLDINLYVISITGLILQLITCIIWYTTLFCPNIKQICIPKSVKIAMELHSVKSVDSTVDHSTTHNNISHTPKSTELSSNHSKSNNSAITKKHTKKNSKLNLISRVYTSLSISFSLSYAIFLTVFSYYVAIHNIPRKSKLRGRILYGFGLVYFSRFFLYLYYLHRIKITFNKTMYEMSDKCYKITLTIFILHGILMISFFKIVNILNNELIMKFDSLTILMTWIGCISWDLIWGTFLATQFITKLKKLLLIIEKNEEKLKYLAKKLTLLACVSVFSTFITFVIFQITWMLGSLILIDGFINCVCLILTFSFFDKYFKKICCCFV